MLIEFNEQARKKLQVGVNTLANAVSCTLGPSGRNVVFSEDGEIRSTKDGVSIAKTIKNLEDPIENIGVEIIKQASIKSLQHAGDGTTTSTVIAQHMINEGLKLLENQSNPVEIKKGMEEAVQLVLENLIASGTHISSEEQLRQIAIISSNNDVEIGNLISMAMEKVGREGVVAIEESRTGETSLEIVEGVEFDKGYKSMYFVTNNNTNQAILDKPYILIYNGVISQISSILPLLNTISNENRALLIIAEDVTDEVLSTLIVNKMRGTLKVCAVKAPGFGDMRTAVLEDIAIITGGTVLSKDKGHKLETTTLEQLGQCRVSNVAKENSTIIDGRGSLEKVEQRAKEIKEQIDSGRFSVYETEKLQERLAKLTGGVAIINVGGANEIELKEKKDRVDDALHAAKAALEEGILPGGGIALLRSSNAIPLTHTNSNILKGYNIVREAIKQPFNVILNNAGIENKWEILSKVLKKSSYWYGYNVKTKEYVNMLDNGILDPLKVTRTALENAVSVAATLLTTEAVVFKPKDEKQENNLESQFNF